MERRVFVTGDCPEGGFWLPGPQTLRYVARVLRAQPGESFQGFDGFAKRFHLVWRSETEGFHVEGTSRAPGPPPFPLALAQGLPKGPKFDQVLRQCTEAGVRSFFPVLSEHSVVRLDEDMREPKRIRWEKILQEASRQCGRDDLPFLSAPLAWEGWVETLGGFDLVLLPDPRAERGLREVLESWKGTPRVALMVGPEGGWSDREREDSIRRGAVPVRLPTPVLRTETASLAAVSMIRYHFIPG